MINILAFFALLSTSLYMDESTNITAHIQYPDREENIIVTDKPRTLYHLYFDSFDTQSGGESHIEIFRDENSVIIQDVDASGSPYGSGTQTHLNKRTYEFYIEDLEKQKVKLSNGITVTLKNPSYTPIPPPGSLDSREEIPSNRKVERIEVYPTDTIKLLAEYYGASEQEIRIVNGLAPNEEPVAGQTLLIPMLD
jgi:hypothetical protein